MDGYWMEKVVAEAARGEPGVYRPAYLAGAGVRRGPDEVWTLDRRRGAMSDASVGDLVLRLQALMDDGRGGIGGLFQRLRGKPEGAAAMALACSDGACCAPDAAAACC
ncbi:MAG TPA: hypothetical protein VHG91_03245 [Longimicrobium sp.]|nr:hypothetical protein [Longimicrobium sp.]